MGTAKKFDQFLKEYLHIHAAWPPIVNTFKLGDYRLISDGVLFRWGNIEDDFGLSFERDFGPETDLNLTSKGTKIARLIGGAEVSALPNNDFEAKLAIEFTDASSFLLKGKLTLLEMQNVGQVAHKLVNTPKWQRRFIVVSGIYRGKNCAILSSTSSTSKIEISGKASALEDFVAKGNVSASLEASNKQDIGLDLIGKNGVVGLAFFKLSRWHDEPKTLGHERVKVEQSTDKDWRKNFRMIYDDRPKTPMTIR